MAANAVIPHEISRKRALVTGASKGIGQAVATRLREAGATVLATARTRPSDFVQTDLFVAADITTANGCADRCFWYVGTSATATRSTAQR